MIAAPAFDRRASPAHAALPAPLNPLAHCPHREHARQYGACCLPAGTVIHLNQDIESSSWWVGVPGGAA